MYPIIFELGGFILPSWHTFYVLAAISTFYTAQYIIKKNKLNISNKNLSDLYIFGYIAGYFGARLLSIFIDQPEITGLKNTISELFKFGAMTFYGGFISTIICSLIIVKRQKMPIGDALDMGLTAGLVGLAVGRIGCFLNGDDFGIAISNSYLKPPWWAVSFPNLQDGVYRYPVQLISTFVVTLVVITMLRNFIKIRNIFGAGSVGVLAVLCYGVFRIIIEFYRADDRGWIIPEVLTPSQFISILGILVCGVYLMRGRLKSISRI